MNFSEYLNDAQEAGTLEERRQRKHQRHPGYKKPGSTSRGGAALERKRQRSIEAAKKRKLQQPVGEKPKTPSTLVPVGKKEIVPVKKKVERKYTPANVPSSQIAVKNGDGGEIVRRNQGVKPGSDSTGKKEKFKPKQGKRGGMVKGLPGYEPPVVDTPEEEDDESLIGAETGWEKPNLRFHAKSKPKFPWMNKSGEEKEKVEKPSLGSKEASERPELNDDDETTQGTAPSEPTSDQAKDPVGSTEEETPVERPNFKRLPGGRKEKKMSREDLILKRKGLGSHREAAAASNARKRAAELIAASWQAPKGEPVLFEMSKSRARRIIGSSRTTQAQKNRARTGLPVKLKDQKKRATATAGNPDTSLDVAVRAGDAIEDAGREAEVHRKFPPAKNRPLTPEQKANAEKNAPKWVKPKFPSIRPNESDEDNKIRARMKARDEREARLSAEIARREANRAK